METSSALFELAAVSLACRDQDTLLKTLAARAGAALSAGAVLVWMTKPETEEPQLVCRARWTEPGERINSTDEDVQDGFLTEMLEAVEPRRVGAREIMEDDFSHLDEGTRVRVKSAMYGAVVGANGSEGVIEVLNKRSGEFTAGDSRFLEEAGRLAGQALDHLRSIENERTSQLATLERLTALYDLGRTFTSTLELEDLLPIVAGKIRDILGAGACNLWLVDTEASELYVSKQAGEDPTVEEGTRAPLNEGLFAEVTQQATPKLIECTSEDESLEERRNAKPDFEMQSWMAAPLRKEDEVLGVVEIVNRADGSTFSEDDLFFLSSISEQAAVALHNANLLESERKVSALDALLKISKEITSTLDLDHVLTTVVHQAGSVVPFDRCVIGFFDRGRFVLGAVSGEAEVPKSREMDELRSRLEWVAVQDNPVWADLYEDGWHLEPEEIRAQFVSFLEAHEYNGMYALPLRDDQGTLGSMVLLSGDADFLNAANKETLGILANQTTVAIRNAQLYQQVPLANLLQPLAERKQKLLAAVPQGRWRQYAERAAIVAVLLAVIPWPMRVGTDATVVPAEKRIVSSIIGGLVERIFVHEGDAVQQGQPLAQLDASEDRVRLAEAEAALAQARRDLAEAEFRNDPSAAGQAKIKADLHSAEVTLEQQRVNDSQLRAPIGGVIVTPKIEDRAGTMVHPGEGFCEIIEQDRMAAEMSVPETDLPLLNVGDSVALKLNALPAVTFKGAVAQMGAETKSDAGDQYFLVRAIFNNSDGRARDGMVGRARVRAGGGWFESGWYPIGYVIFRAPFRWLWQKVWSWLPW
jgi:RND family efflux transporter MFP subunit